MTTRNPAHTFLVLWLSLALAPASAVAQVEEAPNEPGDSVDPPPVEVVAEPPGPVEPPELIPREVLFGNPDRTQASISPNGRWISYLAPVDGVLNAWVAPADDLEAARPITQDTGRGIRRHGWAHTSQHVLYTQDRDGDENWHVYSVDLDSGAVLDLTPFDGVQARIGSTSHHFPTEILVYVNKRSRRAHDLYRVDVTTGEMTLVHKNKQRFTGVYVDEHFQLLFGHRIRRDGGWELLEYEDGKWVPFMEVGLEDSMTTRVIGPGPGEDELILIDSRGRNTAALFSLDRRSGAATLLAEDPQADISFAFLHPTEHHVLVAASNYTRTKLHLVDEEWSTHVETLLAVEDGELGLRGCTTELERCVVSYEMDDEPERYYLYDAFERRAHFLFTDRADLGGYDLAPMHPAVIPSRDGLDLVSYYSLPLEADPDGDGIPDEPLPTVLFVHGGPWGRDSWGYHPVHQWGANRGYAVLSVNFRASTGFGKAFINAGNKAWGVEMHDDLLDAVQWAADEGITDMDRVCIAGGSYGGYATLAGLTFTPDVFACGVDIVGPSNLITLLKSIPPYWKPIRDSLYARVGDLRTREGKALLKERSPLTHVAQIERPLLIGQGANDPRVNQAESDQIVSAMKAKGLPVTYVLFPDEGHGFARPENWMAFFAVSEAFIAQHLGGRYEPIGDDFSGSSIQVPEGAELVPGVAEALDSE